MRKFIKDNLGSLLGLSIIGFFLYIFNLRGPLFWDDADWILNNPAVHALTWANIKFIFSRDVLAGIGQVSNYYRPFLFLTFLGNYLVSGTDPTSYHFVSDAIHILNGVLIFYLLERWLGSKRIAFLAALLFVIHPLQTEAVAYVSGRGDALSVLFILTGIILYLNRRPWWAGGSMILAILSRETAVLFPAYLGLVLMAFEGRGTLWERFKPALRAILPFSGISAVYGLLRLTVLNFQNTLNFYQQQNIYSEYLSYRIYTFFHALLVYLRLIIWPVGLHMDRDISVSVHIWNGWAWLGGLVVMAAPAWLFWLYKKGDRNVFSLWFFGLGIFFINLAPTSGIVPINARIYEHWLYFSLFGSFALAAFYIDRLWSWLEHSNRKLVPPLVIALVAYSLFLGVQTIRRNLLWTDVEGMYLNVLYYEPQDVRVLNNLGNWYSDHGDNADAAPMYRQAIAADPTEPAPYYNLGNIARDSGQPDQAEVLYKKAIEVSPTFHYAYENLAQLYLNEHKLGQALAELQALESILPSPETETNIAALKKIIGSTSE